MSEVETIGLIQLRRAAQAHLAVMRREWHILHPDRPNDCPITAWDDIPQQSQAVLIRAIRVALRTAVQVNSA